MANNFKLKDKTIKAKLYCTFITKKKNNSFTNKNNQPIK